MFKNPVARSDSRKLLNNGVGAISQSGPISTLSSIGCGMNGHFLQDLQGFQGFRIIVSCGSCKSCL